MINVNDRQIYVLDGKSHRIKVTHLSDTAISIVNKRLSKHNISGYLFESRNGKKLSKSVKVIPERLRKAALILELPIHAQKWFSTL